MIRESHELAGHLRCSNNESRLRIWSGCSTPAPSRACRNGNFSNGLRPAATSSPSRRSSPGWGRWSWALAGGCWRILPTWTTPSRRHSSSSCGGPGRSARRTPSVHGCTAWPSASPRGPGATPPGAAGASSSASRSSRSRRSPSSRDPEIGRILDEEINRLPSKYRAPIVLCYLEGRTHEEAARQLSWPVGSVKGRLARARSLLESRLTRRGVASSAGALGLALAAGSSCRGGRPRPRCSKPPAGPRPSSRPGNSRVSSCPPPSPDCSKESFPP